MGATNPFQSVISVVDCSRKGMLWSKSIVHVDSNAVESLNPSSAVQRLIVQSAETEPASMVHDKNWSPGGAGGFGSVDSNSDLGMIARCNLPVLFDDSALFCCSVSSCEVSLHFEQVCP
jgi:hypothetical protein